MPLSSEDARMFRELQRGQERTNALLKEIRDRLKPTQDPAVSAANLSAARPFL